MLKVYDTHPPIMDAVSPVLQLLDYQAWQIRMQPLPSQACNQLTSSMYVGMQTRKLKNFYLYYEQPLHANPYMPTPTCEPVHANH